MLKRLLFWDFTRATWQYDVVVALILAFIFLTPRGVFRDQPRASSVVRLPAEQGAEVFWIEPELLSAAEPQALKRQAADVVAKRTGRRSEVIRVEPIQNSEEEVQGYLAYMKP